MQITGEAGGSGKSKEEKRQMSGRHLDSRVDSDSDRPSDDEDKDEVEDEDDSIAV